MPASRHDFEVCDRCGAMVLSDLASFHQCKGSDTSLRSANTPLTVWANRKIVIVDVDDTEPDPPKRGTTAAEIEAHIARAEATARKETRKQIIRLALFVCGLGAGVLLNYFLARF